MSEAMADQHSDDGNTARMTVETYRQVWRQVRAAAVNEAYTISKSSKMFLRDHFEMSEKKYN